MRLEGLRSEKYEFNGNPKVKNYEMKKSPKLPKIRSEIRSVRSCKCPMSEVSGVRSIRSQKFPESGVSRVKSVGRQECPVSGVSGVRSVWSCWERSQQTSEMGRFRSE